MSTVDRGRVMRRVAVLARYWEGILDAELRPVGVTSKQLQLLGVIERDFGGAGDGETAPGRDGVAHSETAECLRRPRRPRAPTASEVAEAMVTSHQNVMQTARALERRGFLRIERDRTDRRVRRLVLTDEHRRFWPGADSGTRVGWTISFPCCPRRNSRVLTARWTAWCRLPSAYTGGGAVRVRKPVLCEAVRAAVADELTRTQSSFSIAL